MKPKKRRLNEAQVNNINGFRIPSDFPIRSIFIWHIVTRLKKAIAYHNQRLFIGSNGFKKNIIYRIFGFK